MITEVSRTNDFIRKIQQVIFEDEFGARHVINHPLGNPGYDAAAVEADVKAQMEAVCEAFKAAVQSETP